MGHGAPRRPLRRAWLLALLVLQVACSRGLVKELELLREPLSFALAEPMATDRGLLPPGVYYCQYADAEGLFCEAPASLNDAYVFKSGGPGGVYLSRRQPRTARLFVQDLLPNTVYSPGLGVMTVGGSGLFRLGAEVHADFLQDLVIQGE